MKSVKAHRPTLLFFAIAALAVPAGACGGGGNASDVGPGDDGGDGTADGPECEPGDPCDDEVACTVDRCGATGYCVHEPGDSLCADDLVACTVERCDPVDGCVHEPDDTACDDGTACTVDTCDETSGCGNAPDDGLCDDAVDCTIDRCSGSGCLFVPDDSLCTGDEICRTDSGCFEPPPCEGESDPRCDDGQDCTTDLCDPATGRCTYGSDDTPCDDGLYCTGVERCVPFRGCLLESIPRCDDGVVCTIDQCNETADSCEYLAEHRLCNDGLYCTGTEVCDPVAGGCVPGAAPACDDGDACTQDRCDGTLDRCVNEPVDADSDGDPALACGGGDCDDADPAIHSLAVEVCNGIDDNCDGLTDLGTLSECGNCDPTCRRRSTGGSGDAFGGGGMTGSEFDPVRGGLVISAVTSTSNFLWVPNTNESTLGKWDAGTATELARYRVGLAAGECPGSCCWSGSCNMPSRVVVDGRGDAYVANRGFSMQGTVVKIAARVEDCVDLDGDTTIETSTSATAMPWGQDECILWTAPVGPVDSVLRSIAIDRGDAAFPEGYPWVGGYNNYRFWQLNPDTGAVLREVTVPVRPYGAVVVADGQLWIGTLSEGATASVDTVTGTASARIPFPTAARGGCVESYGVTADSRGRIWFSGWGCRDALGYDPALGQWTRVDTTVYGVYTGRGITVDSAGRIWMAVGGDGQSNVAFWNADSFAPGGTIASFATTLIRLPSGHTGPSGVGADRDGNIWVAHHATSQLVRINPTTGAMFSFTGPNRVYTYSDFTGSVRRTVIGTGAYRQDYDAGCDAPVWTDLAWDASLPADTSVVFTVGTAATAPGLDTAVSVEAAHAPPDASPSDVNARLVAAGETPLRHMRVSIALAAAPDGTSPVLRSYSLSWTCP